MGEGEREGLREREQRESLAFFGFKKRGRKRGRKCKNLSEPFFTSLQFFRFKILSISLFTPPPLFFQFCLLTSLLASNAPQAPLSASKTASASATLAGVEPPLCRTLSGCTTRAALM